jgi:hypothetical protein
MRKTAAIIGAVLCALLFTAPALGDAGSSGAGDTSAIDAARTYVKQMQAGDFHQAISQSWDFQTLMSIIFRDDLNAYSVAERNMMGDVLQRVVEQILANPQIRDAMRTAQYDRFEQKQMSDSIVAVRFMATFANGKSIPNTLIFYREPGGWRIVNSSTNGQTLMGARLHDEYLKTGLKPMDYVLGLAGATAAMFNK